MYRADGNLSDVCSVKLKVVSGGKPRFAGVYSDKEVSDVAPG